MKVLVAYASKHGATREIAHAIANTLNNEGLKASTRELPHVENLDEYDAFVLGSAVYMGRWMKEATQFLSENADKLSKKPSWIFSSGPTGEGDPHELLEGWEYPAEIESAVDKIHPREVVLFHGRLEKDKLNWFSRWVVRMVKAELGDFRQWHQITEWAQAIAKELRVKA